MKTLSLFENIYKVRAIRSTVFLEKLIVTEMVNGMKTKHKGQPTLPQPFLTSILKIFYKLRLGMENSLLPSAPRILYFHIEHFENN